MKQLSVLIYGFFSYLTGLAGLIFFFLFVGGWGFLPIHVNSGSPGHATSALATNLGLMLLFGLQHSIMARPGFKRRWARIIPPAIERSTYVLLSGVLMFVICYFWQPLPGTVWRIENSIAKMLLISLHIAGWAIAVVSTFLINHFELMGLQQVYCHFRNRPVPNPQFTDRFFYKIVRHPLQFGLLLGLWSTPYMSVTHVVLSLSMSVYILIGLYLEEKDLVKFLGTEYEEYRTRVRMLLPLPMKRGVYTHRK